MKKILVCNFSFIIGLVFVLLSLTWCSSEEIVLTVPIQSNNLTRVRVSNFSDHPDLKQISFRLSIGYVDGGGNWVEVKDEHQRVENLPAIADNPSTPEDETRPALPRYDQLITLIKTSGKSLERIILERVKTKYAGVIE